MSIERDQDFEQLEDIAAMMAENPGIEFEDGKYVYYGLDGRTAFAAVYISGAWAGWQAKAQAMPECTWTQNEDGYFDTSCGQSFVFSEPDDTPGSHEFAHCCFCGGQLKHRSQND